MGLIIKNGIKYFGDNTVQLTQAQYDALSQEEKLNGTTYYITDGQNITTASAVSYNNTASELTATDVQSAIDEAIGAFKFIYVSATIPSLVQWGGVYGCDLTFDISGLGLTATPRFVGIVKEDTSYNWMINITKYSARSVSIMIHRGTNSGTGTQFNGTLFIIT